MNKKKEKGRRSLEKYFETVEGFKLLSSDQTFYTPLDVECLSC